MRRAAAAVRQAAVAAEMRGSAGPSPPGGRRRETRPDAGARCEATEASCAGGATGEAREEARDTTAVPIEVLCGGRTSLGSFSTRWTEAREEVLFEGVATRCTVG